MVFNRRKLSVSETLYWDVDETVEITWAEIFLTSIILIWLSILFLTLLDVQAKILIFTFPLVYLPSFWKKRLPLAKIVYDATIGSKPDNTTLFVVLSLLFIVFMQALILVLLFYLILVLS
ncbi:MAG: hypothetical protein ACXAB7_09545 [Candidatus Kariarchaeaceae archaeon]|jgi:hypothetical protein